MPRWAWRQWCSDPLRAALSSSVFGAALALCLLFEGIQVGIYADLRSYAANLDADLVALETDARYLAVAPSELPQLARARLEAVPGVRAARPLTALPVIFATARLHSPIQLVAYDGRGGPPRLESGAPPLREGDVVLDAQLARRHGLAAGDRVEILDYPLTVSGLSGGSASPFTPLAFVSYDTLLSIVLESDLPIGLDDYSLLSALLLELDPARDAAALRAALEQALPEADFYTPAQLGEFNVGFGRRLIGPVLGLLSLIAMVIAALTMGLLRYGDVQEQLRQFGIQKALGATPWQLAGALATGSGVLALASIPLALVLAHGMGAVITAWNPLYHAQLWNAPALARGLALGIGAAMLGGLLPLRRLARLDPVVVFQR